MPKNRVEQFVLRVQKKLNQYLLWQVLIWAAATGACCLVAIGAAYIWQGFAVPRFFYPLVAGLAALIAIGVWLLRRVSQAEASAFADQYFGFKDSVTSCRNFGDSGRQGGYFDLQAKQTQQQVMEVSPNSIPFSFPRRIAAVGLFFGATAALMAFVGPSQAVKDRLGLEIATLQQTSLVNDQLEKLIDELDKEIQDDDERELLEPNKLREWVKELRQTDDRKEALRQYAKLEQKLHRASARMDQKRDEQYLERAAKELDKDRETKSLSDKLKQKKYDAAASELSKMEPEQTKKLSERRKQLAKLRAAAKRMAAAAKRSAGKRSSTQQSKSSDQLAKTSKNSESEHAQRSNQEKSSANQSQSSKSQMAKMAQERANSNGKDQQSVEQLVSELQKNLDNLEQQLANAEMQEQEDGECDQEQLAKCEQCQGQAQKSLAKLSSKLGRMGMKLKMQSKLGMLAKACSQGQSELAGLTPGNNQGGASSMVQSPDAGGKKAGWGSSDTHRDERDALQDNGQYSQLKGQKGEGPSLTTLEAAEDGSGVSTAQGKAVSRNFQRQIESFVDREDVPDDVKNGVRNYFEMIHSNEQ